MLSATHTRPLFSVLPLKSGSSSFMTYGLSKQSFVGTSQRLTADFGWSNIALNAGKQPKDTPPHEEEDDEKEAPEVVEVLSLFAPILLFVMARLLDHAPCAEVWSIHFSILSRENSI